MRIAVYISAVLIAIAINEDVIKESLAGVIIAGIVFLFWDLTGVFYRLIKK